MRVIAGSHRGRRLSGPQGTSLRPTSDKVREALFSILGTRVAGSRFLDLYAGTGAVGIEALSRGAMSATFVESDPLALRIMRKNLTTCGLLDRADVRVGRARNFFARPALWNGPYNVVFADPPYAARDAVDLVLEGWNLGLLSDDAVMVIEQDARAEVPAAAAGTTLLRRYDYGDTSLFLYGPASDKSVL